ncbi:hypothetical protein GCM10028803_31550 [Larkinella knui]|uniref:DNA-directed RNA polymerase n=1 Tax=Larkinella knui TaxID=2025310 RepID=A0A3P1CY70_9BACT|nr:hypothetical protein [Larkinella knui]RRB18179.1 hypothetical protein EHT87_07850 [Larkinella knui]
MTTKKVVLLPENLNLEQLLEAHPPHVRLWIENLKYIIGLISELPAYDHRLFATDEADDVLYIPLYSKLLKYKIRDYQHYLRYLVAVGVLECDKVYMVGFKSRAYRFTEPYRVKTVMEELTNPKLVRQTILENALDQLAHEQYPHLIRHFEGLEIDREQAQHYIDQLYEQESHSADHRVRQKAASRYSAYQTMINHLVLKTGKFRVDQSGHRFHSPLTNLKKELRNFLTFQGEPLVGIDLSCSQPYFSTILFRKEFYQPLGSTETMDLKQLPSDIQCLLTESIINAILVYTIDSNSNAPFPSPPCTLMCADSEITPLTSSHKQSELVYVNEAESSLVDGVKTFTDRISNGQFYEYLGQEVERITGRKVKSRQHLKDMVFSVLFSRNDEKRPFIVERKHVFEQVFPLIAENLKLLKSEDHRTLALLLQSIEAEVFLNRIVARITQERPEVPLFSIHDCLGTTEQNAEYVKHTMIEELKRSIGVVPDLKTEVWIPEDIDYVINAS